MANASFSYGPAPDAVGGYIMAFTKEVETPAYIGAVNTYVHAILATAFNDYLDMVAKLNPMSFHHVYEWPRVFHGKETIGNPMNRLWRQTLKGNGAVKVASFSFKASTRPVPVDPILTTPGASGKSVKEGVHIFVWKAPVMEAGEEITVTAKLAKYLAFVNHDRPTAGSSESGGVNEDGSVRFATSTTFIAGGGHTTGAFTGQWVQWWTTQAGPLYDSMIAPGLERSLNIERELGTLGSRWGNKIAKNFGVAINSEAYHAGELAGLVRVKAQEATYINQAAARRALIYGE